MEEDRTTIQISKTVRERLKELGKKGDTYDDIIEKLLQQVEGRDKRANK